MAEKMESTGGIEERELALADFNWANLAAVFGQVLAAATLAYKLLIPEI